jgi:hypothetical protein
VRRSATLLTCTAVALLLASAAIPTASAAPKPLSIGGPATGTTIPAGFLGLSLEYFAIEPYAGSNPSAIDPVFAHFTHIARALPALPLAGPTDGDAPWFPKIGTFLAGHPDVGVATIHRYPLESCYVHPSDPAYPTIPHMLSAASTSTLARSVTTAVRQAHAHHTPIRVDEFNTEFCGWDPSVTRSFASALRALDTLFGLAGVGVDGVNIHTFPGATYALFRFAQVGRQWRGVVMPEYYGLQMFAQAAPPGSRR